MVQLTSLSYEPYPQMPLKDYHTYRAYVHCSFKLPTMWYLSYLVEIICDEKVIKTKQQHMRPDEMNVTRGSVMCVT